MKEHQANREQLLPAGYNVLWINGVQIPQRDVNPFTLLEHLRRERSLINGVRRQGLSGPEAIDLLSNSAITETQADDEPQRYDFRDEIEGGRVIIWLNDIEKDKRYEDWPSSLAAVCVHVSILPITWTNDNIASTTYFPRPTASCAARHS